MTKLISDHYVNQLYKLHHFKKSFGTAGKYKGLLNWFEKTQPKSLIETISLSRKNFRNHLLYSFKLSGLLPSPLPTPHTPR